jgi:guanine deaminase
MNKDIKMMRKAIGLSIKNVEDGGGPFGAVIVKDGKIVSTGVNRVTANRDPTAHAEVTAIRKAAKKLGTFDLSGCEIYTSCEPCPMCLGAIYWAHLDRMYFGNTKVDAKEIGFDDSFIYEEIELNTDERKIKTIQLLSEEAYQAFRLWKDKSDKIEY